VTVIQPLSDAQVAAFGKVGAGQISDAMESLGFGRTSIPGFRFLAPAGSTIVGTAVTLWSAP